MRNNLRMQPLTPNDALAAGFGPWLRTQRLRLGWTLRSTAARVGRSEGWWRNLEASRLKTASDATLVALARILKLAEADVFTAAGRAMPSPEDLVELRRWRSRQTSEGLVLEAHKLVDRLQEVDPGQLPNVVALIRQMTTEE